MTIFWDFLQVFLYKTFLSLSVPRCINNSLQHHLEKYIWKGNFLYEFRYSGRTKYSALVSKLSKLSEEYLSPQKTQKAVIFFYSKELGTNGVVNFIWKGRCSESISLGTKRCVYFTPNGAHYVPDPKPVPQKPGNYRSQIKTQLYSIPYHPNLLRSLFASHRS